MALADLSTYCVTSLQLALAYPDPTSGLGGAAAKFLSVFAITQIPLAIMEGLLGVIVLRFLARVAKSDLVRLHVLRAEPKEPVHV